MKKYILILFMFSSSISFSQELMNFYLSPNAFSATTEGTVLMLYTTFYYYHGAGLIDYSYEIEDDVINFRLCYVLSSVTVETLDKKGFEIKLPEGTVDYTFNIELYTDYNNGVCNYEVITDSGSIDFSLPYTPNEKVEIDDEAFESYLEYLNFGDDDFGNGWVFKHRVENITSLHLSSSFFEMDGIIESLSGINHFPLLKDLRFSQHAITSLNLTENTELEWIRAEGNPIEDLDISNCNKLNRLWANNTNLSSLDVSNNSQLEQLEISGGSLTSLSFSNNILLNDLYIKDIMLMSLDLSNNSNIIDLEINNTLLSSLDLTNNSQIAQIKIEGNELLTSLDITNLTSIINFTCLYNEITDVDLSTNPNLYSIFLLDNNLSSLNIKNGNNENIDMVFTLQNPNLFCIEVDHVTDINGDQPFGYQIDSQTEFSEDCP